MNVSFFRHHHFRVVPLQNESYVMICEPERDNPHDATAVIVRAPDSSTIPPALLPIETRPGQTVRNLSRRIIGRVPATLCSLIWHALSDGSVLKCECLYTGTVVNDGPVTGGGHKLFCVYILTVKREANTASMLDFLKCTARIPDKDIKIKH